MKKHIFIFALTIALIAGILSLGASAAELKSADVRFSYAEDEAYLEVSGVTPATYGQHLTVLVYDPSTDGNFSLEILKDDATGEIVSDPALVCPLADLSKVIRIKEIIAASDGSFNAKIPVSDSVTDGQYIIVQISGGGKYRVSSSYVRMYKTAQSIESEILREFAYASDKEIGTLLKKYELLLGVNLDSKYDSNKAMLHSLFVSVRDDDILEFNSLNDILKAWDYANYLLGLSQNPSASDVANFIENYKDLIGYDFSENNTDYTEMADKIHSLAAENFRKKAPGSMKTVKETLEKSAALSMVNSKNASTATLVIEKYADLFGIDVEEYQKYCKEYGEYEVNKAFAGQNFKYASDVSKAFEERIEVLKNKNNQGSSGGGGGGGIGGGGTPSSSHDDSWMTKEEVTVPEEKEPESKENYSDMNSEHWAYESVSKLSEKGVINGFDDGTFKPDNTVTREQFVKMLVTAFEINGESDSSFSDVDKNRWSAPFIEKAVASGITNGVSDKLFAPEAFVTRQDAAVMLYRICNAKNISLTGTAVPTDADEVSDYAKESVNALAGAGIIRGFEDGSFKPLQSLTRAQAAKLIYSLLNR